MKKILLISVLLVFSCCSTVKKTQDSKGNDSIFDTANVFSSKGIHLLQQDFDWIENEILIVNYHQPINRCDIETFHSYKNSTRWWDNFYSKIDLENCKNIFVYSPTIRGVKPNNVNRFVDKNHFCLTISLIKKEVVLEC